MMMQLLQQIQKLAGLLTSVKAVWLSTLLTVITRYSPTPMVENVAETYKEKILPQMKTLISLFIFGVIIA